MKSKKYLNFIMYAMLVNTKQKLSSHVLCLSQKICINSILYVMLVNINKNKAYLYYV